MGESGMMHISVGNSKMGPIPSFSLPPIATCRCGVPCAKRCYARLFHKSVLNGYDENFELAHHLLRLENELNTWFSLHKTVKIFRIHVSGDYFSVPYLKMWIRIARNHKDIQFFSFSKQWDVVRQSVAWPHNLPKNFTLILSAWMPIGDRDVWMPPKDLFDNYPIAYVIDPKKRAEQMVALEKVIGTRRLLRTQECTGNCEACGLCFRRRKKDGDILFSLH